jgi:hypothetical protein
MEELHANMSNIAKAAQMSLLGKLILFVLQSFSCNATSNRAPVSAVAAAAAAAAVQA